MTSGREARALLVRHDGNLLGDPVQRLRHDRSLGGGKVCLQSEPASFLVVPPPHRPGFLHLPGVIGRSPHGQIPAMPDATAGHPLSPRDQLRLGFGSGEPRQLHHLVDAKVPARERSRDQRQPVQSVSCRYPAPSLPVGQAEAHPEQLREVTGSPIPPSLETVSLGDESKELPLIGADAGVKGVHLLDESRLRFVVQPGPRLSWSRGR